MSSVAFKIPLSSFHTLAYEDELPPLYPELEEPSVFSDFGSSSPGTVADPGATEESSDADAEPAGAPVKHRLTNAERRDRCVQRAKRRKCAPSPTRTRPARLRPCGSPLVFDDVDLTAPSDSEDPDSEYERFLVSDDEARGWQESENALYARDEEIVAFNVLTAHLDRR